MRLSEEFRRSLDTAATAYQAALGSQGSAGKGAASYLSARGISPELAAKYHLGVVDGSSADHLDYQGMICLPYQTKLGGVVSLKFRQAHNCTDECRHAKYISPYPTRLYNTLAFERADELGYIGISEGEFDAQILDGILGIPTVAVPGVDVWRNHAEWPSLFAGYKVLFFPDADEDRTGPDGKVRNPGRDLADKIKHDLPETSIVPLPGADANDAYLAQGAESLRRIIGEYI